MRSRSWSVHELLETAGIYALNLLDPVERLEYERAFLKASPEVHTQLRREYARFLSPQASSTDSGDLDGVFEKRASRLPDLQKVVLTRAYVNGESMGQISADLKIPASTIKSALSRALVRIRERSMDLDNGAVGMAVHLKPRRTTVDVSFNAISSELIRQLGAHPQAMRSIPPRLFEELIAELLSDMGFDIEMTPETRDGGSDVLIAYPTPLGPIVGIVECKRWAEDRPVGIDIVERFLFTLRERDRRAFGVIATTTFFTQGSRLREKEYCGQLLLRDSDHIADWLRRYGTWRTTPSTELWTPMKPIVTSQSEVVEG